MNALALLALWGCGSPPTITSIDPTEALPGATLKILGENFADPVTVQLVQGDQTVAVPAEVRGPILIEGTLPSDLAAGSWTVSVDSAGTLASLSDALTITAVEVETPCGGKYKANTQLALARDLVVIDRFYDGGERETMRIGVPEIDQVEYELVKLGEETLCSVIYMRKKDGTRVSFDDDTRLNLEPRAYKLGNVMKKPVKTTRKDVEDDPRPVEEN